MLLMTQLFDTLFTLIPFVSYKVRCLTYFFYHRLVQVCFDVHVSLVFCWTFAVYSAGRVIRLSEDMLLVLSW